MNSHYYCTILIDSILDHMLRCWNKSHDSCIDKLIIMHLDDKCAQCYKRYGYKLPNRILNKHKDGTYFYTHRTILR